MAFNPPLGDTSPAVLLDNATRLDKLVNGQPTTVPDRAGDPLYSWRGRRTPVSESGDHAR